MSMIADLVTGFLIEVLLITNLFVFVFNNLLRYLNFRFPQHPPQEFIRTGAFPKPFDIPLYLLLSVIGVFILWILHLYMKKVSISSFKSSLVKFLILIFLVLLFLSNIGIYPMAHSVYPYENPESTFTYHRYLIMYLLVAIIITIESVILGKLFKVNRKLRVLFFIFIVFFISLVTLEPRFPIVGHDYSYFFGPIWEVSHGKTLYTQVPSQYGFLAVLFITFLYKIGLFNVFYLPALVWLLYIIEYSLCFYLVYRVSKNLGFAVIGLISIITINYFSIYHLPASIPQTGPMRWLPLVVSLFFFYKLKSLTSRRLIFIISLLSFWVLDSGLSLILAYCFSLFLLFLNKNINFKTLVKGTLSLIFNLLLIYLGINLFQILLGYRFINIASVFLKLTQYAKAGFGMIPMDPNTHFWFVLLIYFASLIFFFRRKVHDSYDQLLIFAANLSLFASVYFVGRSHPHNLFHISLFPILNLFLLLSLIFRRTQKTSIKLTIGLVAFIVLIAYPIYNRQEVMTKMVEEKIRRFQVGNIFKPEAAEMLSKKYEKEIKMINNEIPEKKIVILSPDDTYLFYLTEKENLMDDNSQITILTQTDMNSALQNVYRACPNKIVADCTLFNKCIDSKPFTVVAFFSIQPLILNRIQEVCKITYLPVDCTNQLCVAVAKKNE